MTAQKTFQVGVSLHSFAVEYCSLRCSFEDMMQRAATMGRGVEIVGPSHHRGFPEVTLEFERAFKSSLERNGLIPTSYGTYADPYMLPDRNLTPEEMLEYTIPQLRTAAKLGFPIARMQYFVYPIAEKLLPYAQKFNVKMGYELHVPLTLESPKTQTLLEQVKSLSSEYLGIIPDCGIFARSLPKFVLAGASRNGVPDSILDRTRELWTEQAPLESALAELKEMGLQRHQVGVVERCWGSFAQSDPEKLREIMPYVNHIHGKFFTMENGDEPDLRYSDVVRVLLEEGYMGWMNSEFEGMAPDSFVAVQEHQAMVHRYIAQHTST